MQSTNIVFKVGGNFFEDANAQEQFFSDIKKLRDKGFNVAIVHGGGSQLQTQLTALGFETKKHQGLRVSPDEQMPAVTGVLAGTLNKKLVAMASQYELTGVGISLADGNLADCVEIDRKLGAVGYPKARSAKLLHQLMHADLLPIICSIGSNDEGRLFNVNADQAAACIASLLYADLYFLCDVSGVLDHEKKRLPSLNNNEIEALIQSKVITDGMEVKVRAAQEATTVLNKPVTIGNWSDVAALTGLTATRSGTQIQPS
ncbi:acetylglutamate kinase [Glaciecola sp. MH2013]|uniref:acetylglutamate kinase n=1 Tax=Glaciecola sp. MH2013 TaxID=2785524 RepID=UPI001E46944E|nr:acetylglutamate kinase [Glaciecola sp. MH2013]